MVLEALRHQDGRDGVNGHEEMPLPSSTDELGLPLALREIPVEHLKAESLRRSIEDTLGRMQDVLDQKYVIVGSAQLKGSLGVKDEIDALERALPSSPKVTARIGEYRQRLAYLGREIVGLLHRHPLPGESID